MIFHNNNYINQIKNREINPKIEKCNLIAINSIIRMIMPNRKKNLIKIKIKLKKIEIKRL